MHAHCGRPVCEKTSGWVVSLLRILARLQRVYHQTTQQNKEMLMLQRDMRSSMYRRSTVCKKQIRLLPGLHVRNLVFRNKFVSFESCCIALPCWARTSSAHWVWVVDWAHFSDCKYCIIIIASWLYSSQQIHKHLKRFYGVAKWVSQGGGQTLHYFVAL